MSKNTLFNYFNKSPAANKVLQNSPKENVDNSNSPSINKQTKKNNTSSRKINGTKQKKAKENSETNVDAKKFKSDSEEEEEEISPPKRKRLFELNSDDSEDEYKPDKDAESSEEENLSEVSEHSESEHDDTIEDEHETSLKSKKRKAPTKKVMPNKKRATSTGSALVTPAKAKLQSFSSPSTPTTPSQIAPKEKGFAEDGQNWPHLKYDFLQPERIKDAKNRRLKDPDYCPRTLYVPEEFKRNQTPAMRQWWEMKSKHYDCVLFFKVGKFYELYHMDAVTGANELGLSFMKGDFAHSGFPEIAYGRFSATLVDKGYKVARVEQTETPDMMTERCKTMNKVTKFDKVVKREICQLTTKGTRVFTFQDGEIKESECKYLLAVAEKECDNGKSIYGVCFVDTSIGMFHLGQFSDDKHCSRLRTLLAHHPPAQFLYERGHVSPRTQQVMNTTLSAVLKEHLAPESEFWNSNKTLLTLMEKNYFTDNVMPEELKQFLGEGDSLGLTAKEDAELAIKSLGAITWYLIQCQLDHQLLSMGQFSMYTPVDINVPVAEEVISSSIAARHMVLDAVTLKNLHVLENSIGGVQGTLLNKLDLCCTHFGKRLLHQWLCSPLTSIPNIEARQKAVTVLLEEPDLMNEVRGLMTKLPDLERQLCRIYAQSSRGQHASHPDSRAIFFEEKTYSKKKIVEFSSVLNGFKSVQEIGVLFQKSGVGEKSDLLLQCSYTPNVDNAGQLPDLSEHLEFFKNAFNHEEAEKEGHIIPRAGVDPDYDNAVEKLNEMDVLLKAYLKQQCEHFGTKVTYVGTDKKRFQLEVSESASKKAGAGYELQGQRKGFKRYWTPKSKELLEKQIAAEDAKKNVLHGLRKRIFSRFSERYNDWSAAIQCVSVLDVLMSFAEYCRSQEGDICVPQFVAPEKCVQPFVELRDGRYPCVTGDEVFIPNDTVIGNDSTKGPSLVLVTGPNMGGKSTLMRQLGLITIMAQMGCHVPASSLKLSPVDRIFTRLGANDDIMAGESTFYVELCETSTILMHATKHSLVLIDELGRGTSTYDGTAIAAAVLKELCAMQSRTLFSTHYHSLVEDFKDNKNLALGHMACMAENESDEQIEDDKEETVTFLYKFAAGACPKSYGFNAARLAGVPSHITKIGSTRAKQLEFESNLRKNFQNIFQKDFNSAKFKLHLAAF